MAEQEKQPIHPGKYVKENILPEGISVKKAAERMGIGRPALSNFLNGNAQLSQNMATRLAKAFNADKSQLISLQQEYETYLNHENEKRIAVKSYAPLFLNIRATHIDTWADKHEARALLPALLRRLVNSTGSEVTFLDFPAYDNSQRKGWDGKVESNNVTPWVPSGVSGWEFGCDKNPNKKANDDYEIRTKNVSNEERKNTTFVFVTPRNWKSKDDWIKEKKSENEWKDVRAFDANDIEQWLELSVSGQVWLAENLGHPQEGCQTLDNYWKFWSETAKPAISKKIFDSAVTVHSKKLIDWYHNATDKPLVVTAGSKEEALAFITCAADSLDELSQFSQQAVLVSKGETVKRLAAITTEFIPIANTNEAEKELVTIFKNRHSIVVTEKNLKGMEPDIIVDLPSYESFRDALTEMGFDDAQREILSSQSGKSPTILRRQLADIPSFKKPAWAISNERIQMMVPLVLAGTWKSNQEADKEILKFLADKDYINVEKNVAELVSIDDAPLWSEGKHRGVISKLDCLHAISDQITEDDLSRFFFVAECILSEDDPALDLDKDKRWMANIYDKVRDYSSAIRESICESLIILSIHGDGLFGKRLGINIESRAVVLIRKLLSNKNSREWHSQQSDLPMYAEAAPEEFLDIIQFELTKEKPAFAPLFEPADSAIFSRCDRTGMLWALELLAWKPSRLARVAKILAQLCRFKLEDNWANKPIGSLKDIFLSWMPHTAATVEQRCEVMELICREFPEVGWNICMSELKPFGRGFTSGTYRPRWRSDASGAGQPAQPDERVAFLQKCREIVLSWSRHTLSTLSDLIECLTAMNEKDQQIVEEQIKIWLKSSPPDEEIIKLREHVRTNTMTQRVRKRNKNKPANYTNGKKLYELLEPKEIIQKHQWLFAKQWVEYTPEELEEDDFNHEVREEKLSKQRITALKEILKKYSTDGVIELCLKGEAGFIIGVHLARDIMNEGELHDYIIKCLVAQSDDHSYRINNCLSGILTNLDDEKRYTLITCLINNFDDTSEFEKITRLLINAPFNRLTWDILESQNTQIQNTYWEKVVPGWGDYASQDFNFFIDKLVEVNRPCAAFKQIHFKPGKVESARLINLLHEVATNTSEREDYYRVAEYEIEEVLKSLNGRDDVERSELSKLEYLYIPALTPLSEYGIPNLSKDIAESPMLFMQMLAMIFRRDDDGKDPEDWNLPTEPEHKKQAANNAYNALEYAGVIPGSQDDGTIDVEQLREWIVEVRKLAKEHGRKDIADQRIGQILSKSNTDPDGIWPRKEVRHVFEEIASYEISIGMEIGLRNSRGAEWRPDDGSPERVLADKYRDMANSVMNKTPFVGRMLMRIAQSYDHDADWHDSDDRVRRRLRG